MKNLEFNITSRDEQFRVGKISPVDLLAISTQIDFEKLQQTKSLIEFCLECTEVKLGDHWAPVKVKGREVYCPVGIEEDIFALNEIFTFIMSEVIVKAFTKSSE